MNDPVVQKDECDFIKCSNCNKNLLVVPSHDKEKETLYMLQAACAYCGDKSYQYEVKGPLKYCPAPGLAICGFKEIDNNVIFSTKVIG